MACVSYFTFYYDPITGKKQLHGARIYFSDMWRDSIQLGEEGVAVGSSLLVGSSRSLLPHVLAEEEAERSAWNQEIQAWKSIPQWLTFSSCDLPHKISQLPKTIPAAHDWVWKHTNLWGTCHSPAITVPELFYDDKEGMKSKKSEENIKVIKHRVQERISRRFARKNCKRDN